MSPPRAPADASAIARFVATVDLPTPPFPLDTAMMRPSVGYDTGVGADERAAAGGAAFITGNVRGAPPGGGACVGAACDGGADASFTSTRTSVTPSTASIAWRTS